MYLTEEITSELLAIVGHSYHHRAVMSTYTVIKDQVLFKCTLRYRANTAM
mgnify:CR=1 FL=1